MIKKEVHKFKKGQFVTLDSIYSIQGLGGGDWWERTGLDIGPYDRAGAADLGEDLVITKNITITITVKIDE